MLPDDTEAPLSSMRPQLSPVPSYKSPEEQEAEARFEAVVRARVDEAMAAERRQMARETVRLKQALGLLQSGHAVDLQAEHDPLRNVLQVQIQVSALMMQNSFDPRGLLREVVRAKLEELMDQLKLPVNPLSGGTSSGTYVGTAGNYGNNHVVIYTGTAQDPAKRFGPG